MFTLLRIPCLLSIGLLIPQIIQATKPNIVFIITDDQDLHMQSLDYMPLLQKHLINEGTLYKNHYCTVALCCPSRVNLWTGKAAHNTNVTDVAPPHGGYPKFISRGYNDNYLPVWLQQAGYNTYYTGKLFNHHTIQNYFSPVAGGFTGSDFLLDPYTYQYYNASMSRNGGPPVNYEGQYSPDVVAEKALGFLDEAVEKGKEDGKPFFLVAAPIAPHSDVVMDPFSFGAPKFAERHSHLFEGYKIPRTRNFNPDTPSSVSWISRLPRLNSTVLEYNDDFQRSRLRALQSVDEAIASLITSLSNHGILNNTYIFYTTDNGYHISQHRLHPGKTCGFEEDINIPLIVRGPGVDRGKEREGVSSHTDLAPTIMKIALGGYSGREGEEEVSEEEVGKRYGFDGRAIAFTDEEDSERGGEHVGIEYWGRGIPEGKYGFEGTLRDFETTFGGTGKEGERRSGEVEVEAEEVRKREIDFDRDFQGFAYLNNTYKALRVMGEGYSLYFSVWCSGERELYDMVHDPDQLRNLLSPFSPSPATSILQIQSRAYSLSRILTRLNALLLVLKSCSQKSCIHPWSVLHPSPSFSPPFSTSFSVTTFLDALNPKYDTFYQEQPEVRFDKCELGYIRESEGPQDPVVWDVGVGDGGSKGWKKGGGGQVILGEKGDWSVWT